MNHLEHCEALESEIDRFAATMASVNGAIPVPSCPGWNVLDVAEHLGVIHRWAEELVRRRSPARIARDEHVALADLVTPEWISDGGRALVVTLRDANPDDAMWAWGRDQHVRFWSRRQLHETLVHRMDLELAAHIDPRAEPRVAVDAIDEFLSNLEKVATSAPELVSLRGHGERLGFRSFGTDDRWRVTLGEEGFVLSHEDGELDCELLGEPVNLLLALLRRKSVDDADVEVVGDRRLLDFWLAHSAYD